VSSTIIQHIPNIVNLRCFAVFGKYEDYETRFISNAICRSLYNLPITINQDVKFDYFPVSDLAQVIEYFITHTPRRQFYNVGSGKEITLTNIVNKISELSRRELKVVLKEKGFNKQYTCDNGLLLAEMPQFKFTDFGDAFKDLYDWYSLNLAAIDKNHLIFDK